MKKFVLILLGLFIIFLIFVMINCNINSTKQDFIAEAREYLNRKYFQKMIVADEVIIGDEKSVLAYPESNPELCFFVRKGKALYDTYLSKCLCYEAERALCEAFGDFKAECIVSDLKWCNPTESGEFETFVYLDKLYASLGRVPLWEDINGYQKIEEAEVNIIGKISSEEEVEKAVEYIKSKGCNIETLVIKDSFGYIFQTEVAGE